MKSESPVKVWRRQKIVRSQLGRTGKIVTWTIIRAAGSQFAEQAPYPVVLVQLKDADGKNMERLMGQLVDYSEKDLVVGRQVVAVLRRLRKSDHDVIPYGLKFRPSYES